MSQRAEQTSFFSAFLNYAKVNTSVTSKSMGSLDSKIGADGMKSGNSCNSPRSCEIKCRSFKKETELSSEKSTVIKKFLSSPEKKLQRENDWLIDFNLHVEKAGTKKQTCPKTVKELSEKESENQIGGTMSHSPAKHKVTAPRKSPKHDCSSLSAKDLQSSPSQNLRQRIKKDSKSQNDSSKSKSVRGIQFNKDENSGVRRNLRPGKRKRQEEHVASDTDSEISFKPMPKRRRVNLTDTYKMAPLSPLQTRGRKLAKAVKGLQKTITEKREFKKLEKQTRLARTSKVSGSPKKQSQLRMQKLRMCQKRKYEAIRSSPRTKNSATPSHGKEMEESVNKQLRHHFKQSSDSQSKRINPVIKKRRQKMKYKTRMLVNEKNESKLQSGKTSSKTLNSVSPQKLSPKTKQDQNSQSFQQLCEINSSPKRPGSKISAGKQAPHSLSPSRNENKSDSLFRLEDAPFNQKSLSFSSLAGSQSLPATPTTSTSDMGFFRSSPRPNTLSISNSSSAQGINKITSNQSALDSSTSYHYQGENNSQFTKLKTKRTLAETVDMLRHTSNLNGLSVFKYNSFKKKTLTPSDDQSRVSSRNSSRSNSPSITPIKSEVLTPSCTPCSTPRKSPSCSPSPSLDKVAVTRLKGDQKYLFRKGDKVLAQWHDGLYYLGIILKIEEKAKRCLLRYEDNSKYWSLFKDIHRGARDGEMICCVCMSENSEKPNEIVLCDNCGQGYHQNCHSPAVRGSEILDPDDEWCCRKCIFALTMKAGGALKEGKYGDELRKMKLTFPYDLKSLSWDTQHKTNTEQYYCYCGGPGVWYQKMLQCCRCKQWFHEACIQCLKFPLMFADSFYIFVCSACNFGQEYIKRLNIDWPDLVHISIFNMSMENNLKYYEFDEDIMMWINDNWDILQVKEYDDLDLLQRREEVKDALNNNKSRFKNGTEIRKRQTLWGLRVRVPPPRTHITLPVDGLVNDEVMKDLKVKGRRSKVFMPIACKTPVQMRHSPLQLKGAARRRMLQNSPLLTQNEQEIEEIISEPPVEEEPEVQGPLLDRLIPPASSYEGYNHPFKHEIEQTCEKIETEQRLAIWNHFLSKDKEEDDSVSLSPEGPPVLVKEEPVENLQTCGDMSPPLSETSESSHPKRASRRSNTPTLISAAGLKRSKRISGQKITRNTPPHLEQNPPVKQEISVTKVKSAKANYLCAFDKLGYGKGLYVLGKRETEDGKLDYLISW